MVKDYSPTPIDYRTIDLEYKTLHEKGPKKRSKTTLWLVGPPTKFIMGWKCLGNAYWTFRKQKDFGPTPKDNKTIDLDYKLQQKRSKKSGQKTR